jgi:hypothetical protein
MILLGHPYAFVKIISDEKAVVGQDGLTQRFLFSCPKPQFNIKFNTLRHVKKPSISILSILFIIRELNEGKILYTFTSKADALFGTYFDLFTSIRSNAMNCETYIG